MRSKRFRSWLPLVAALLAGLVPGAVAADFSPAQWRYVKPVVLPPGVRPDSLVQLLPDSEVFAGSAPGLVDLRIIAGESTEVPYKLEVGKGERQRTSVAASVLDKGYVPGRHTTFTADLGRDGILHNEVEFRTPVVNFRRRATVETSRDGAAWMKVAEDTVFDFTVKERNFNTSNTRVRYPDSTTRYLRMSIADDGEGALEVSNASIFLVKEIVAKEVPWRVSILNISRDTARRATLAELDLAVPGLPSYRIGVAVPEVNFDRQVSLETSVNRADWRVAGSRGRIYAYDTPKFSGKHLDFTYPESTARYLRLVIHDGDSPPLTVQDVKVWGLQRRLVFTARPGEQHRLYYGNPAAARPSYDIERVFPYLETDSLPEATPGAQSANPRFEEKLPPVSDRLPWLLPAAIAGATALVALLLVNIIRQARKLLPPPRE